MSAPTPSRERNGKRKDTRGGKKKNFKKKRQKRKKKAGGGEKRRGEERNMWSSNTNNKKRYGSIRVLIRYNTHTHTHVGGISFSTNLPKPLYNLDYPE